jgi:hypothetical protein
VISRGDDVPIATVAVCHGVAQASRLGQIRERSVQRVTSLSSHVACSLLLAGSSRLFNLLGECCVATSMLGMAINTPTSLHLGVKVVERQNHGHQAKTTHSNEEHGRKMNQARVLSRAERLPSSSTKAPRTERDTRCTQPTWGAASWSRTTPSLCSTYTSGSMSISRIDVGLSRSKLRSTSGCSTPNEPRRSGSWPLFSSVTTAQRPGKNVLSLAGVIV